MGLVPSLATLQDKSYSNLQLCSLPRFRITKAPLPNHIKVELALSPYDPTASRNAATGARWRRRSKSYRTFLRPRNCQFLQLLPLC